ncbi:hypothetical protein ACFQ49_04155 [Kroppenstedtia eburnea]|uniref:Uncharacterized protein n=1 Tax=Kroppenstedtia eburnea TaxID=714067 RepID=A0A1N7J3S7_9BACL|nr:hypothetical protein [Kroppenstedtia eburnea]EGK13249.1 dolichyl-phosphate-mannose-protein mannosyltransferase [Desmospora sp. 8437]QKI82475.1 hypothetical protein GXN75_10965 [Kroppenstedtia eburnea]SIS43964.1 hypothetical protein SAMN05421790_101684 [Kroppenstedtia eburnea]
MIRWVRAVTILWAGIFVWMLIGLWLETALHVAAGAVFALYAGKRVWHSPSAVQSVYLIPLVVAAGASWWGLDLSLHSHEVGILYVHGVIPYIRHTLSVLFSSDGIWFSLLTWLNLGLMAGVVFILDPGLEKRQAT